MLKLIMTLSKLPPANRLRHIQLQHSHPAALLLSRGTAVVPTRQRTQLQCSSWIVAQEKRDSSVQFWLNKRLPFSFADWTSRMYYVFPNSSLILARNYHGSFFYVASPPVELKRQQQRRGVSNACAIRMQFRRRFLDSFRSSSTVYCRPLRTTYSMASPVSHGWQINHSNYANHFPRSCSSAACAASALHAGFLLTSFPLAANKSACVPSCLFCSWNYSTFSERLSLLLAAARAEKSEMRFASGKIDLVGTKMLPYFVRHASSANTGSVPRRSVAKGGLLRGGEKFRAHGSRPTRPIRKLLIANRGEIAVRVHRACKELGIRTVGIYSQEDALSLHRQVCDESYLVGKGLSPVAAYLHYPAIIDIAVRQSVDAIHPGYGFLSENGEFAAAVETAGIMLVGPSPPVIAQMGDKIEARLAAEAAGVPAVPGSDKPVSSVEEAAVVCKQIGFPVMLKAAFGGGGRGMRRVYHEGDLQGAFERASSEALAAFGDGSMFVERLVETGVRHIEVQVLGDRTGDVVALPFERDCSVQRRHQKLLEISPAPRLSPHIRARLLADAVRLMQAVGYENAGTVEFLLEKVPTATVSASKLAAEAHRDGHHQQQQQQSQFVSAHTQMADAEKSKNGLFSERHYFMEVNARLQVEHTITEEVTGVDLVKAQLALREGATLTELGLTQERLDKVAAAQSCCAIQCRITTEDSQRNFQPAAGRIDLFQPSTGPGIRLDGAIAASGAVITPFYDSLLVKVIAKGKDFAEAVARATRALRETKIRGITTNISFLLNVLQHPEFLAGQATTHFVDDHQQLLYYDPVDLSSQNICRYFAHIIVNGPLTELVRADAEPDRTFVRPPSLPPTAFHTESTFPAGAGSLTEPPEDLDLTRLNASSRGSPPGLKTVLNELGPKAFAKHIKNISHLLLTDTTLRDAHQSLLATRMRTYDMVKVAPAYAHRLPMLFSLENWGGATFDVAYRFLRESPWRRLELLREAIPNIPFQMLLRGANAVGYTAYADNVIEKFCQEAVRHGMDIFRVFDSLNYLDNLQLGIQAAGAAGGVVEAAIAYTGDVADPKRTQYTLEYYLNLARELVATQCHILCIKDMAGLLTPPATKLLISTLRKEFPDMPIHLHTHDTAGCGVATNLAAAEAGADVVDVAIDSMSGLTSQPSMGAVIAALKQTPLDPGIDRQTLCPFIEYFEQIRLHYSPFEATATLKSVSSDVYENEIPGGQYTNLHMQAFSMGMGNKWAQIKAAYAEANKLLGSPPKVTPSSKVVGDLAQFIVQNGLNEKDVLEKADSLSFPSSVVQYLQGALGQPPYGFPEPLRSKVLRGMNKIEGRPGAVLPPVNWEETRERVAQRHGRKLLECEVVSSVLYPEVFDDFQRFLKVYGDVSILPTAHYFKGPLPGETVTVHLAGREVTIKFVAKSHVLPDGSRDVFFEVMGLPRTVNVMDIGAMKEVVKNRKADPADPKQVASPMPGNVLQFKVEDGQIVHKGDPLVIISAMKMETVVVAPIGGTVAALFVRTGDPVQQGDLLVQLR